MQRDETLLKGREQAQEIYGAERIDAASSGVLPTFPKHKVAILVVEHLSKGSDALIVIS